MKGSESMKRLLKVKKLHVKTGDMVEVISGKNKGQSGKVAQVSRKEGKVIVEGVNISTKHLKPTQQGTAGSLIKVESPMYACKVMLVCPKCNKRTRVAKVVEEGVKKRKCKKCNELF